jgi:hypothetical protein
VKFHPHRVTRPDADARDSVHVAGACSRKRLGEPHVIASEPRQDARQHAIQRAEFRSDPSQFSEHPPVPGGAEVVVVGEAITPEGPQLPVRTGPHDPVVERRERIMRARHHVPHPRCVQLGREPPPVLGATAIAERPAAVACEGDARDVPAGLLVQQQLNHVVGGDAGTPCDGPLVGHAGDPNRMQHQQLGRRSVGM